MKKNIAVSLCLSLVLLTTGCSSKRTVSTQYFTNSSEKIDSEATLQFNDKDYIFSKLNEENLKFRINADYDRTITSFNNKYKDKFEQSSINVRVTDNNMVELVTISSTNGVKSTMRESFSDPIMDFISDLVEIQSSGKHTISSIESKTDDTIKNKKIYDYVNVDFEDDSLMLTEFGTDEFTFYVSFEGKEISIADFEEKLKLKGYTIEITEGSSREYVLIDDERVSFETCYNGEDDFISELNFLSSDITSTKESMINDINDLKPYLDIFFKEDSTFAYDTLNKDIDKFAESTKPIRILYSTTNSIVGSIEAGRNLRDPKYNEGDFYINIRGNLIESI